MQLKYASVISFVFSLCPNSIKFQLHNNTTVDKENSQEIKITIDVEEEKKSGKNSKQTELKKNQVKQLKRHAVEQHCRALT